jgi:hypothetical protein
MSIYRFRVSYEEDETIYRDIDIRPAQTAIDFRNAIVKAYSLPDDADEKLSISNDSWHSVRQLQLILGSKRSELPMLSYIDDPHQKFLYEHDGKQSFTFLIELMQIVGDKNNVEYPVVAKTVGPSPVRRDDLLKMLSKREKQEEEYALDGDDEELEGMEATDEKDETEGGADDDISKMFGDLGAEGEVEI